ncbi:MAG TPA: hypothetical protein VFG81_20305 [Anaerolineales bacterium]|jgi:hypothetical protein|nr:hypothetical protein [Anaerolineales bacterium]
MTVPNDTQMVTPEIVVPPSVSNLSIAQVGTGMFSVTMQVVMVVRFPTNPKEHTSTDQPVLRTPVIPSTTGELIYGNGELPNVLEGEAEGFQAFVQVHGYIPPTREVLIQWATNSQGGA